MIDPTKISNFNLTILELEENILFWVAAAGKNGVTSARLLHDFLNRIRAFFFIGGFPRPATLLSPFKLIRKFKEDTDAQKYETSVRLANELPADLDGQPITHDNLFQWVMKDSGIGNHTMKSRTFMELAHSNLDLKNCTIDDLSKIHGIGPKTARAFLVHTRPNQRYAVVDTHLLKFLRDQGIMAPKSTPPEGPQYQRLEKAFLDICDKYSLDAAHLDLTIWNHYRKTAFQFNLEAYANDYHQSSVCSSCDGGR